MKKSDRYLKLVEWSEKDQCYVGTCPTLFYGGCHGDNEAEVYQELCAIVAENITLYEEEGKPLPPETATREYSDKLLLCPGKDLHSCMNMEGIPALFDGKDILPDNQINLAPNTRIIIRIETVEEKSSGKCSFLKTARSLNLDGPKDWSERLDYYLYHHQLCD